MATGTYYPDAHTEVKSVDGWVAATDGAGIPWATLRNHAGSFDFDDGVLLRCFLLGTHATSGWIDFARGILLFDGSADVSAQLTVTSATLTAMGHSKTDGLGVAGDVNVYESAPASDTAIVAGDFDSLLSTPLSTAITYADFIVSSVAIRENTFVINAAGLAVIQTALRDDGIIKLGLRNANYDVANIEPTWSGSNQNHIAIHSADNVLGLGFTPRLEVTFVSAQYPTNPLSRVTGIIYRRSPGRDTQEILMGGISPDPVVRFSFTPETAVPTAPPAPGELPLATGLIGPFFDPVNGAEFWIDIHGKIIWTQQRQLPPRIFQDLPEDFEPDPLQPWPGVM